MQGRHPVKAGRSAVGARLCKQCCNAFYLVARARPMQGRHPMLFISRINKHRRGLFTLEDPSQLQMIAALRSRELLLGASFCLKHIFWEPIVALARKRAREVQYP